MQQESQFSESRVARHLFHSAVEFRVLFFRHLINSQRLWLSITIYTAAVAILILPCFTFLTLIIFFLNFDYKKLSIRVTQNSILVHFALFASLLCLSITK